MDEIARERRLPMRDLRDFPDAVPLQRKTFNAHYIA
jgi:hypothetical protein